MKTINFRKYAIQRMFLLAVLPLVFAQAGLSQVRSLDVADQVALVTEFEINGLKVLIKRRPNTPTVAAGLFFRGGARNIDDKNSGIENLTLEVAAEGSKKFPREILRRELSATGSSIGASSTYDYSVLSLASTLKDFDRSWDIFTDIARNPAFDPSDIDRVQKRILSGLKEEETDNDNFLNVLQNRIIYANHPYSNNVTGSIATVGKFRSSDLIEYHKNLMHTSRLLLVVVGDLDPGLMRTKIAGSFGTLPKGSYRETPYPKLDFSRGTLDVTPRSSLPTNYIRGIFNAPSLNNPDYYPMQVATTILNSRLFQEVRIKRQLSYAPSATLDSLSANSANIYVTAVDANQTVAVMLDVIKSLKQEPVRQEEIDGMAGQFLTNYYLKQETNAAQAHELAKYELVGGGWRNAFEFLNRLRSVTSDDVQAVSQKYMRNIRFVVIGNPVAIEKDIFLRQTD